MEIGKAWHRVLRAKVIDFARAISVDPIVIFILSYFLQTSFDLGSLLEGRGFHKAESMRFESSFVVEIGWRPDWQGIPPSFGQLIYAVQFLGKVKFLVFSLKNRHMLLEKLIQDRP